jgi:hypothetical protein
MELCNDNSGRFSGPLCEITEKRDSFGAVVHWLGGGKPNPIKFGIEAT